MVITEWTDEMLADLCWEMMHDETFKGMERQGRPLKNIEMSIIINWEAMSAMAKRRHQKEPD